jgi:hypothetical protein
MFRSVVPVHSIWNSSHITSAGINFERKASARGTGITEEPTKPVSLCGSNDTRAKKKYATELCCVERLRGTPNPGKHGSSRNPGIGEVTRERDNWEPVGVDLHQWRKACRVVGDQVMTNAWIVHRNIPVSVRYQRCKPVKKSSPCVEIHGATLPGPASVFPSSASGGGPGSTSEEQRAAAAAGNDAWRRVISFLKMS